MTLRITWLLLFTVALIGCQSSDQPPLSKVSGVVTLDGKPLDGVAIQFSPVGGGRPSIGMTDANGSKALGPVPRRNGIPVATGFIAPDLAADHRRLGGCDLQRWHGRRYHTGFGDQSGFSVFGWDRNRSGSYSRDHNRRMQPTQGYASDVWLSRRKLPRFVGNIAAALTD